MFECQKLTFVHAQANLNPYVYSSLSYVIRPTTGDSGPFKAYYNIRPFKIALDKH